MRLRLARVLALGVMSSVLTAPAPGHADEVATVYAAASLSEAFADLGTLLEQRKPPLHVTFNFAGSQQLAAQIEQGATADVFASADRKSMAYLHERGLLAAAPRDFVGNRLVVVVPNANPGRIERLEDLARSGIKLVLGAEAVPVGRYSREALGNLNAAAGFGAGYSERVLRNVVSHEENVKGVVAKVQLGEADAGMVYRSDVTPSVAAQVRVFEIPTPYNVIATYPVGILKDAPHPSAAHVFITLLLSPEGQQVLRAHGLVPLSEG